MARIDTVVIGLGVIGSAALRSLAARGLRVLGIERFEPGHDRGSSHGATRIIRLSYFEHPSYVWLLREAYPLWRELEAKACRELVHITGIVEIGTPDSALVRGTLAAAREHDLRHEILNAIELMRRHPAFRVPSEFIGVAQPDGGFVDAEATLAAQIALARAAGAEIRTNTTVRAIEPRQDGVRVVTDFDAIDAAAVVVAAGARISKLLPGLPVRLRATRQVLAWFEPRQPDVFDPARCPVFLVEGPHGTHYGFPLQPGAGVKVAKHHHFEEVVDPDDYDRNVSSSDEAAIRAAVADYLPSANGKLNAATTCLYTMAPDGDFIIDTLPGEPRIIVASPCSGHGFKFAPLIGEIVAELATTGTTTRDITRFRLDRFIPRVDENLRVITDGRQGPFVTQYSPTTNNG
jgi:sarcosine oxidase